MIKLTRLNDNEFYLNPDLIEFIEETPNTVISLTTGKKLVVVETIETVVNEVIEFKRKIFKNICGEGIKD